MDKITLISKILSQQSIAVRKHRPGLAMGILACSFFCFLLLLSVLGISQQRLNASPANKTNNKAELLEPIAMLTIQPQAISIKKSVSTKYASANDTITYTISLINHATNRKFITLNDELQPQLSEPLEPNLVFSPTTNDKGTLTLQGRTLQWDGNLKPGQELTLTYQAVITDDENLDLPVTTIVNSAFVLVDKEQISDIAILQVGPPGLAFLPYISKKIPTATPSPTPTPSATPTLDPNLVKNGNLELGRQIWQETSRNNFPLIVQAPSLPEPVQPHEGNYAIWLGGKDEEMARIAQTIALPSFNYPNLRLQFYYWIASRDNECGAASDRAYVVIDLENTEAVRQSIDLCDSQNTNGWNLATPIPLGDYRGKSITVAYEISLDSTRNSNFFVDDIVIVSGN